MRVSVVIPAYNAAAFLPATLAGVRAQTVAPHEVIVVDDGSTDGTATVAAAAGPPVRVIRQANSGVSAARNAGIAAATGDFVAFLDADDEWLPDRLAAELALFEAEPALGTVIADELFFTDRDGVVLPSVLRTRSFAAALPDAPAVLRSPVAWLLREPFVSTSSVLVRRSLLDAAGPFDVRLSIVEDRDMWLRLAALAPMGLVPRVLVRKRQDHGANLSRISELAWARALESVLRRREAMLRPALAREGVSANRIFAARYGELGSIYWHSDELAAARRCLASAVARGRVGELPRLMAAGLGPFGVSLARHARRAIFG